MKILFALTFASVVFAGGPAGPIAGFVLDSRTGTIRAITGAPGATRLADALALPFPILAAEFSSSGDTAVAITADRPGHLVVLGSLISGSTVVADLGEVAEGARLLGLNARGTGAIVYSPGEGQLRFVNGIGKDAVLSAPVPTAALAGPVTAGVLDEAGSCSILGTGSLETLCADGSSRRVLTDSGFHITQLALSGSDLWLADEAGKQVLRVADYAHAGTATVFATEADGLRKPLALEITQTGQVLVADSEAPAIFVIDPAANSVRSIALDVAPSQLRPLTDRSLLLINDLSALPFTLFATEAMRTYFVPAN